MGAKTGLGSDWFRFDAVWRENYVDRVYLAVTGPGRGGGDTKFWSSVIASSGALQGCRKEVAGGETGACCLGERLSFLFHRVSACSHKKLCHPFWR